MRELREQLLGALMVILTVAAVICAGINYQQQSRVKLPEDGVTWVDQLTSAGETVVVATHLLPDSPAAKAGIRRGDVLRKIGGVAIGGANQVAEVLDRIGAFNKAAYALERNGKGFEPSVYLDEVQRDRALYFQYAVGAGYLITGLFLYFRRSRAPRSLHFFILCLASFVVHTFHYTGKLNTFDAFIYYGNVVCGLLAPALFLHFCLVFPQPPPGWGARRLASIYLPAVSLMALQIGLAMGFVRVDMPPIELRWTLDRAWLALYSAAYIAGGVLLHLRFRSASDPIMRQQLKWLRNGTLLGIVPFAVIYVAPFLAGFIPAPITRFSVLCLAFMPLAWAYAVLRYRLMDVDIIFQQGYVYVLATLSVLGVLYAIVYAFPKKEDLPPSAVIFLIVVAALVFEPLRNWIQQQMDRYVFYKDQWDYRRTLLVFARELSSEMDLDHSLSSVGERLISTLSLSHAAFFLDDDGHFRLRTLIDRDGPRPRSSLHTLDLSFLRQSAERPYLFFERTSGAFDVVMRGLAPSVRETIAELDLTYYLPCVFRGRTVAWLGVSRTVKGDFLSSEDVDLLASVSGYVAMAVENARLYRSLADKAEQYERLKEFSENIVESINVGILAADLNDRVESWNSQIERLTGIPRHIAVGRRLHDLFPDSLTLHLDRLRGVADVHQLYKLPLLREHFSPGLNGAANGNGHAHPRKEAVVNLAVAPLVTRDGQQIGRLVIFDDVTEREDLERRLVQADKLSSIGLLAAGVAHEVNTPLAVISTYAQMLTKQVAGDEAKSKLLDKIAKQTFRASEIVNSLLNFSRTSSADYEEIDINRVVRETLALVDPQFGKAGVEVVTSLEPALPGVRGNMGRLQQVFLNLFLNARDAMESGGTLSVSTCLAGESVRAEVRDTGPGIPREQLARVFDPFFTTKTAKKGTGLGLSVSYGIVEEHGGAIEAFSEPGHGATFRLEFPAVRKPVNA